MEILTAVFTLLIGLAFLGIAAGNLNYERDRRRRGVVTEGVVVDAGWDINKAEAIYQAPVVEYVDQDGATQRFRQRSGTTLTPEVGSRVRVWYDPANPGEGPVIDDDAPTRAFPFIFGGVGVVVTLIGVVLVARLVTG